jgi:centromere/kinetochore protein ZW10
MSCPANEFRFTYNDSIWLCDKLEEFQSEWIKRTDLSPRAFGKVKLETEIKTLQSFGKRAYTTEMNTQRTVIGDLLGGTSLLSLHTHTFP